MARAHATRLMLAHETALERHLATVFASAGRVAASHYSISGQKGALAAIKAAAPAISRVLGPSLHTTARTFGDLLVTGKAAPMLERKVFEDLDQEINAFIDQHTADRVVQISDSLRAQIVEIIRQGLEEQLSTDEVAQAIVDATQGEMAAFRARRIARTETHTAANAGQLAAARRSPLKYQKQWLAVEDARTREAHAAANGQTVELDEPFVVGGEEMMMPGDPNASAGNVINCRCTVLYVPTVEPQTGEGDALEPAAMLDDIALWRAFFEEIRQQNVLPSDLVLYASGPDCGLPLFASAEDLQSEIGQQINVPRGASVNPILVNGGQGILNSFPLYGRPVVVKITVPAGTPANVGKEIAMEVVLDPSTVIVITDVTEDRWGDVQDEAGVPIDPAPQRRRRRLPSGRGVTLVEAEVQA
jgi:SPP1 gp7 family putative phage head morphogenesis protein